MDTCDDDGISGSCITTCLHLQPAPRPVCLAEGSDILDRGDGFSKILNISRNYSTLEAVDAIHQQVVRFMRLRRTDQPVDVYIAEFDLLRRKAEFEMDMGAGCPEQFISILRIDNAYFGYSKLPLKSEA